MKVFEGTPLQKRRGINVQKETQDAESFCDSSFKLLKNRLSLSSKGLQKLPANLTIEDGEHLVNGSLNE